MDLPVRYRGVATIFQKNNISVLTQSYLGKVRVLLGGGVGGPGLRRGGSLVNSLQIGHVRYINIPTWLRGFQVELPYLELLSLYSSLLWETRDKRNLKNLQFSPESLGATLEYWYIELGLLGRIKPVLYLAGGESRCFFWPGKNYSIRLVESYLLTNKGSE